MDDILDKLLDSDCSDLDDDIKLGEDERVLYGGGVGYAHCGGVEGNADVAGADVSGRVGDTYCDAGGSIVRDGSTEDSVCRDSGDECGGLVGGDDDDDDQSDNDVDSGGDGDCLRGDNGGPDCLHGGVHVCGGAPGHGGVCVCGVGCSGRDGGCVCVGGHRRHGGSVCDGVHGPGLGHGVHDHGVADLQWEPVDTADEVLLDDTFPFN